MKTDRNYQAGRSIQGWGYGPQITEITQIKIGDYLIGDSHRFHATNLYRVFKIVQESGDVNPTRFIVIYVRPDRRETGENTGMCVWHGELDSPNHSYYQALQATAEYPAEISDNSRCDCERPGYFCSGIPGIVAHLESGSVPQKTEVESCDLCERYPSDKAAREKLRELGLLDR
jgi:hypothetical protein